MRGMVLVCIALAAPALGQSATEWAKEVGFTKKWPEAIGTARRTGRLLVIYNGWEDDGVDGASDGLKAAFRNLAAGSKGFKRYRRILQEKLVCLNHYCTREKEAEGPRGPKGPYRFEDTKVPVLVIKRWDGETLVHKSGFPGDWEAATKLLAKLIDEALEKNGPVIPPRYLVPLDKGMEKARKQREKGRIAAEIRELGKVVESGDDLDRFPESAPPVALEAALRLKELEKEGFHLVERARTTARADAEEARALLKQVERDYGGIDSVKEAIEVARGELDG